MAKLQWDRSGQREFEAGVSQVVLFPMGNAGYEAGVAWNGITAIQENPGGADVNDLFADDIKYASLRAAETFGCTIEAYTYPPEWNACDGSEEAVTGVFIGQQPRKAFGLVYKTKIGDDTHPGMDKGYKLHIIYNCTASPSSRGYTTINENPDAISFSWDAESTPVACTGHKAVSTIVIDSTKATAAKLTALENKLFGTSNADPELPDPDTVISDMDPTRNSVMRSVEEDPEGDGR